VRCPAVQPVTLETGECSSPIPGTATSIRPGCFHWLTASVATESTPSWIRPIWGLAKVYGEDAAQCAIRASHRALLFEVLKKPLAVLLKDVPESCSKEHLTEREFLAALTHCPPKPLSPAALAHLRSVLSALSALVESRDAANLRGAS